MKYQKYQNKRKLIWRGNTGNYQNQIENRNLQKIDNEAQNHREQRILDIVT